MTAYTGSPPTFTSGQKTGVAAGLNNLRDFARAFTDARSAWTPSVTGWTLGNGTVAGVWARAGKLAMCSAVVTLGSTTTVAASLQLSVPTGTTARAITPLQAILEDVGSGYYFAPGLVDTAGKLIVGRAGTSGLMDAIASTAPFTWATGDKVRIEALWEVA